jgi:hypothetical protein
MDFIKHVVQGPVTREKAVIEVNKHCVHMARRVSNLGNVGGSVIVWDHNENHWGHVCVRYAN